MLYVEHNENKDINGIHIKYQDDIIGQSTIFHVNSFEVTNEFRGNRLRHILAKKQLTIAGAYGLPFFVWPATSKNNGNHKNDPERLKNFWMNIQAGMVHSTDWNKIYHFTFNVSEMN